MATTTISCEGQGKPWNVDNSTTPPTLTCPVCELSNAPSELNIKTRTNAKTGKITPSTLPQHDIEVDGTELRYILTNGDFQVHSATCPQPARDIKAGKSDYQKPATLVATDAHDAVIQLWDDQLREQDDLTEAQREDLSLVPDSFLNEHHYYNATHFHSRCLGKVPGFEQGKSNKAKGQGNRDARRLLAARMIEAMARELTTLKDTNLTDTTKETQEQRFILSNLTNEQIDKIASAWCHHYPADRQRWVDSGMPIPDRSDWREVTTASNTAETTETTDEEDEETDTDEDAA
jgi:hypothetical protein